MSLFGGIAVLYFEKIICRNKKTTINRRDFIQKRQLKRVLHRVNIDSGRFPMRQILKIKEAILVNRKHPAKKSKTRAGDSLKSPGKLKMGGKKNGTERHSGENTDRIQ